MDQEAQRGISGVLLERFERGRLPRVLKIKQYVDQGLALDDADLEILRRIVQDVQENRVLVTLLPDCRDLFTRAIHVSHDITTKALDNETHG